TSFTCCAHIALPFLVPAVIAAQVDSHPAQRPGFDQFETVVDRSSLARELENLQAQLAAHPQADKFRADVLTTMASAQSRLGFLAEAKRSSQAVLSMTIPLAPECLGVNHFVLANALNLLGAEPEAEYLEAAHQFSIAGPAARTRLALTY